MAFIKKCHLDIPYCKDKMRRAPTIRDSIVIYKTPSSRDDSQLMIQH